MLDEEEVEDAGRQLPDNVFRELYLPDINHIEVVLVDPEETRLGRRLQDVRGGTLALGKQIAVRRRPAGDDARLVQRQLRLRLPVDPGRPLERRPAPP